MFMIPPLRLTMELPPAMLAPWNWLPMFRTPPTWLTMPVEPLTVVPVLMRVGAVARRSVRDEIIRVSRLRDVRHRARAAAAAGNGQDRMHRLVGGLRGQPRNLAPRQQAAGQANCRMACIN